MAISINHLMQTDTNHEDTKSAKDIVELISSVFLRALRVFVV